MNSIDSSLCRPPAAICLGVSALLAAAPASRSDTAGLIVHDTGHLIVNSEVTVEGGTGELLIENGGTLSGCGIINANIVNMGEILGDCGTGTFLVVNGDLTNDGTIVITNCTGLQVSGTLLNNPTGLLDTRGGSMTAGTFTNNGTYLFDGGFINDIELVSFGITGADYQVTAITLSTKTYVLEVSSDLQPSGWVQVGFPQSGTDGPLNFTHINGALAPGGKAFYRVREVAP
jgi:hypothetical protein